MRLILHATAALLLSLPTSAINQASLRSLVRCRWVSPLLMAPALTSFAFLSSVICLLISLSLCPRIVSLSPTADTVSATHRTVTAASHSLYHCNRRPLPPHCHHQSKHDRTPFLQRSPPLGRPPGRGVGGGGGLPRPSRRLPPEPEGVWGVGGGGSQSVAGRYRGLLKLPLSAFVYWVKCVAFIT